MLPPQTPVKHEISKRRRATPPHAGAKPAKPWIRLLRGKEEVEIVFIAARRFLCLLPLCFHSSGLAARRGRGRETDTHDPNWVWFQNEQTHLLAPPQGIFITHTHDIERKSLCNFSHPQMQSGACNIFSVLNPDLRRLPPSASFRVSFTLVVVAFFAFKNVQGQVQSDPMAREGKKGGGDRGGKEIGG